MYNHLACQIHDSCPCQQALNTIFINIHDSSNQLLQLEVTNKEVSYKLQICAPHFHYLKDLNAFSLAKEVNHKQKFYFLSYEVKLHHLLSLLSFFFLPLFAIINCLLTKAIKYLEDYWLIIYQILQTNIRRIVWQIVRRIIISIGADLITSRSN